MEPPVRRRILKMFGESVLFSEEERDEARSYLTCWKKYLLRRMGRDCYQVKVIDELWGEIDPRFISALSQRSGMYLKIIIEFEWNYEDGNSMKDGCDIDEQDLNRFKNNGTI